MLGNRFSTPTPGHRTSPRVGGGAGGGRGERASFHEIRPQDSPAVKRLPENGPDRGQVCLGSGDGRVHPCGPGPISSRNSAGDLPGMSPALVQSAR